MVETSSLEQVVLLDMLRHDSLFKVELLRHMT